MNFFKFVISCVSLLFLFSCCTVQSNLKKSADGSYPYYKHAIKLQARKVGHNLALIASGFALDNERILTAGHFCMAAYEGQIKGILQDSIDLVYVNNNDEIATMEGGQIDAIHEEMDLCVIKRKKHGVVPLPLSKSEPKINDPITVVGGPLGVFPVTSEGRVVVPASEDFPVVDLNNRLVISALGTFGSSGGPVINEKGEVVGIVMAKLNNFLLLAVRTDTINQFLQLEYGE